MIIAQKICSLVVVSTVANKASIAEPTAIWVEWVGIHRCPPPLPRLTMVVGGSSITIMKGGIAMVLAAHIAVVWAFLVAATSMTARAMTLMTARDAI
jgi:hypothetical protein